MTKLLRYIELNPIRARMASLPESYPWSSYRFNGLGEDNPVLTTHQLYLQLGKTDEQRRIAYRALFDNKPYTLVLEEVRACTQSGTPLGGKQFRDEIEPALQVKVGHARRRRPARQV